MRSFYESRPEGIQPEGGLATFLFVLMTLIFVGGGAVWIAGLFGG